MFTLGLMNIHQLISIPRTIWTWVCSPIQGFQSLFRCKIELLNFSTCSMAFNIIAPYMEMLHINGSLHPSPAIPNSKHATLVCWLGDSLGLWCVAKFGQSDIGNYWQTTVDSKFSLWAYFWARILYPDLGQKFRSQTKNLGPDLRRSET